MEEETSPDALKKPSNIAVHEEPSHMKSDDSTTYLRQPSVDFRDAHLTGWAELVLKSKLFLEQIEREKLVEARREEQ